MESDTDTVYEATDDVSETNIGELSQTVGFREIVNDVNEIRMDKETYVSVGSNSNNKNCNEPTVTTDLRVQNKPDADYNPTSDEISSNKVNNTLPNINELENDKQVQSEDVDTMRLSNTTITGNKDVDDDSATDYVQQNHKYEDKLIFESDS